MRNNPILTINASCNLYSTIAVRGQTFSPAEIFSLIFAEKYNDGSKIFLINIIRLARLREMTGILKYSGLCHWSSVFLYHINRLSEAFYPEIRNPERYFAK